MVGNQLMFLQNSTLYFIMFVFSVYFLTQFLVFKLVYVPKQGCYMCDMSERSQAGKVINHTYNTLSR